MTDFKLQPRSSSLFMRFLNIFGAGTAWTTVGNTIYYPDAIVDPMLFPDIIEHEKVHVEQFKKYSVPLFLFLYVLVPLPLFFSYFRWKFEREAYVVELKYLAAHRKNFDMGTAIDQVVKSLWSFYVCTWPTWLMRSWFKKQLQ